MRIFSYNAEIIRSGLSYFSFNLGIALVYVCSEIGKFSMCSAALPVSTVSIWRSFSSGGISYLFSIIVTAFRNFENFSGLEPSKVDRRIFSKFVGKRFVFEFHLASDSGCGGRMSSTSIRSALALPMCKIIAT